MAVWSDQLHCIARTMFCCCCREPASVPPTRTSQVNRAYVEEKPRGVEIEIQTEEFYNALEDPVVKVPIKETSADPEVDPPAAKGDDPAWRVVFEELVERQESRESLYDDNLLRRLDSVGRIGPTPTVYRASNIFETSIDEACEENSPGEHHEPISSTVDSLNEIIPNKSVSSEIATTLETADVGSKQQGSIVDIPAVHQPISSVRTSDKSTPEFATDKPKEIATLSTGAYIETTVDSPKTRIGEEVAKDLNESSSNLTNSCSSLESDQVATTATSQQSADSLDSGSNCDQQLASVPSSLGTAQEACKSESKLLLSAPPSEQSTDSGTGSIDIDAPPVVPSRKKRKAPGLPVLI